MMIGLNDPSAPPAPPPRGQSRSVPPVHDGHERIQGTYAGLTRIYEESMGGEDGVHTWFVGILFASACCFANAYNTSNGSPSYGVSIILSPLTIAHMRCTRPNNQHHGHILRACYAPLPAANVFRWTTPIMTPPHTVTPSSDQTKPRWRISLTERRVLKAIEGYRCG